MTSTDGNTEDQRLFENISDQIDAMFVYDFVLCLDNSLNDQETFLSTLDRLDREFDQLTKKNFEKLTVGFMMDIIEQNYSGTKEDDLLETIKGILNRRANELFLIEQER
jgi:hypothetical protein|tara:strand:+ start:188 stop:514 length:327 start_codon:yes stop_codon:yes gene_type:complete